MVNKIQCSEYFTTRIKGGNYLFTERGVIDVKGKGPMTTFWVDGLAKGKKGPSSKLAIKKTIQMVQNVLRSPVSNSDDCILASIFSSNVINILIVVESAITRKILWQKFRRTNNEWNVQQAETAEKGLMKLKAANFMYNILLLVSNS